MRLRQVVSSKVSWMSAGAIVVAAGVLTATTLANAAAPPLPRRTPAQLLVAMHDAKFPAGFSGVIKESANLGFPSIPNIAGLSSPALNAASLLTGTHTVDVWYAGPSHVRIAVPVSFGETDLRVNDNQVWLWESHSQTATRYVLPARPPLGQFKPGQFKPGQFEPARVKPPNVAHFRPHGLPGKALRHCIGVKPSAEARAKPPARPSRKRIAAILRCLHVSFPPNAIHARPLQVPALTPQQAVDKLLKAIGPTTKVTVIGTVDVAGRAAYQLRIAPRSSQSLIDRIVIAVDARTHVPLQLQVFGRGTASPALQIGFTSLSLATPAMSNFTFTPPPGAHVKTEHLPLPAVGFGRMGGLPGFGLPVLRHLGWHATAGIHPRPQLVMPPRPSQPGRQVKPLPPAGNPGGYPNPPGLRSPVLFPLTLPGAALPGSGLPGFTFAGAGGLPGVQVLGSGWLSVGVFPTGPMAAVPGRDHGPPTHTSMKLHAIKFPAHHPGVIMARPATGSVVIMRAYNASPQPESEFVALIRVLLNAATPVHGNWGSGKLLRTTLFSALITSNGKVLIGAVTPAVLYADAAKVK